MTLPIVPEPPGVVLEGGNGDTGRTQELLRLAAVEAGRIIDEHENVFRQAELLHHHLAHAAERGQRHQAAPQRGRREAEESGVDSHCEGRSVSSARERVQHVADAQRIRVGQVEGAAVEPVEMGEMIDRGDDEVDRHDIDSAALDADHRNPRGHDVAQLLDELEEVVGAVNLVDLACSRVADDDAGAIDPPGDVLLRPHQPLALMLGGVIRMLETARLVEHVLAENAIVQARRSDRAHVMEAARLDRLGEGQRVRDACDVGSDNLRRGRLEVVNGGEMEETVDLPLEIAHILG